MCDSTEIGLSFFKESSIKTGQSRLSHQTLQEGRSKGSDPFLSLRDILA